MFAPFASFERLAFTPQIRPATRSAHFFVAGVGRVDRDLFPDYYVGDYGASWAGVYSGRDGSIIHAWPGAPGEGRGPGREAGDVNRDGRVDLAVGDYLRRPDPGRSRHVFSGATGAAAHLHVDHARARTSASTRSASATPTATETDLLLSAAEGDTVYLVSS